MINKQNDKVSELSGFLYEGKQAEPQFIVLVNKKSNRLSYVCDFVFHQALLCNYVITDNSSDFKSSKLNKVNYTSFEIEGSFHIQPSGFIDRVVVEETPPPIKSHNNIPYFFPQQSGDMSFDVFSAVFYFISRYEEWQKFVKDIHGRFEERNSILYKLSALKKPVVDIWLEEFKTALRNKFSKVIFSKREFKFISTIDVDNLYAFKGKPFFRNAGGAIKDLMRLNTSMFMARLASVLFGKKDPFDKYEEQIKLANETGTPLIYFFLYKNNTEFDRTIRPGHPLFLQLFDKLKLEKISFGIHPSYFSSDTNDGIKTETDLLSEHSKQNTILSRQHYLRFNIKTTPQYLEAAGIQFDFTMGFASASGFRAGTTLPFYYYNFEREEVLKVMAVPFALMDGAYYIYANAKIEEAKQEIELLIEETKKVNGLFVTVFHERSFAEQLYPGWRRLYSQIHHLIK
ncbi:MAG: polysaccharide deacetylase family protein [Bacteroidetes bacterium]|nr:polysaccharide deacetylase family protein [Bacteroidota bacterium]